MYPLRFEPIFRRYIWGGRRLATLLNKRIGDQSCAESWEIVDHNEDQSIIKFGQLAGKSLNELIQACGADLLGSILSEKINDSSLPEHLRGRFPLLLKFLDANRNLSVQVHPDDNMGATLDPPDLGKTEAWYIMHAEPGATIYAGLKPDISVEQLRLGIENGTTEELLHSFHPRVGDCVFIRAGTLHAIGAGLLIVEIQQSSDTTFRIFDWNRLDVDGKPRDLHIEQSLAAIDFGLGPINSVESVPGETESSETLITCEKFVMRRWTFNEPIELNDDRMHILAITKGQVTVTGDPSNQTMNSGDTMLIPAVCNDVQIQPSEATEMLEICLRE